MTETTPSRGSTIQAGIGDHLEAPTMDSITFETVPQIVAEGDDDCETHFVDRSCWGFSFCSDRYNSIVQSSVLQSMEHGIRRSLATSNSLRFFTATVLSLLIVGVVVSCFLTIPNPWIVFTMICIFVLLVTSFHYVKARCDSTLSEFNDEDVVV